MTIVVAVSTPDGLVFASDSATTQMVQGGNGEMLGATHIWNSANKIFNLRKCWPVGAMTFGRATFHGRPVASHVKDLRRSLAGEGAAGPGDALDEDTFEVGQVAERVAQHFKALYETDPGGGPMGFIVGGVGAMERVPEVWQVQVEDGSDPDINQLLTPGQEGVVHQGMTEPIVRLMDGVGFGLSDALVPFGVPPDEAPTYAEAIRTEMQRSQPPLTWQGMPLGESIQLARFLVETTINFVRFTPGAAVVGGPVELAALTKYEGFKWIARKHYYPQELNVGG